MASELILPESKNVLSKIVSDRINLLRPVCRDQVEFQKLAAHCIVALNELNPDKVYKNQSHTALIAAYNAIAIGLAPGSHMGLGYFIPRKGKLYFEIGYRGYIQLGYRSGFLSVITPVLVYRGEDFEYRMTENGPVINHSIGFQDITKARQEVVASYCFYQTTSGGKSVYVSQRPELDQVDSGEHVWLSHYGPMAMKTSIRKASKSWPLDNDSRSAVAVDDAAYTGIDPPLASDLRSIVDDIKSGRQRQVSFDDFPGDDGEDDGE